MSQQIVGVGAIANDGTGDTLRAGGQKIDANFTELYSAYSKTVFAGSSAFVGTTEQKLTSAIASAVAISAKYVMVPLSMTPFNPALVTNLTTWGGRLFLEGQNPGVFDIRAYGAQATLASDQTAAIQAAIDAQHNTQSSKVWMPAGSYAITTLKYYNGSFIEGEGFVGPLNVPGTQLYQGSAAQIMLKPANAPGTQTSGFTLRGFSISSSGNAANLGGLDVTNCTDYVVEDVLVAGPAVFGVNIVGGAVEGNSGFGHFTRVIINGHQTGAYAWVISSSAGPDQPDGLTFTDCRTSSATGTWIHYVCVGGNHGPGSNRWSGCTFEAQGGSGTVDVTVDAAGAGPNLFVGCRFENTGTGGIQVTLNGFGIQPFANFIGCTWAPGSGGFTWTDNGPVLSRRFADSNGTTNDELFQMLGIQPALVTKTANYTATYNDHTILADATAGNFTVTLPTPSAVRGCLLLKIKKVDASANTVTIAPAGPNIDGSGASIVLDGQNRMVELQTDGTNWFIVGAHGISPTAALENKAFAGLYWGPQSGGNFLQIDGTPKFIWSLGGSTQLQMDTSGLEPTGAGGKTLGTPTLPFGNVWSQKSMIDGSAALVSGTTPAIDARAGQYQTLTVLTNIAVVIAVPTNPPTGASQSQDLFIAIRNGSGGALTTAPTFNTAANGFKFSAGSIVNMANGTQVIYHWRWDPVQSFWYLVTVSAAI